MKADTERICRSLRAVISEVFGSLFFLFPEEPEEGDPAAALPEAYFISKVAFQGIDAELVLYISRKLAEIMAENLLGPTEAKREESLIDVSKEAANVVAGNLLTRCSLDVTFSLGIPEAEFKEGIPISEPAGGCCEAWFNVEDQWLRAEICYPSAQGFGDDPIGSDR